MIKDNLQIILITYNRKEYLQKTFDQILADTSPIKDFDITILDNKSTDGTSELIEEYKNKFPNINHVINNKNIGGNANIARAFEIASKKYIWILCDDDEYNFDHWVDVENAIKDDYDAIVVANYSNPKQNVAQLLKQMSFVPSTIYKVSIIDSTVMANVEFCISTMFPQYGVACEVLNNSKNIKILDNWIVKMIPNADFTSYTRGLNNSIHPYQKQIFWQIGFINTVQLIKDKKLKDFIIDNMDVENEGLLSCFQRVIYNNKHFFKNSKKNFYDLWVGINFKQKCLFLLALLIYYSPFYIRYEKENKQLKFKLFWIIKFDIKL